MIKKTVKYTDFNGQERTEELFFHLSKADLIEMEAEHRGGLKTYLERIVAEQDTRQVYELLSNIILRAYGKKSVDGSRFEKGEQLRQEFRSSEAYSELMMDLLTHPTEAAEFLNGMIPHDLRAQLANQVSMGPRPAAATEEPKDWNVFERGPETPHVPTESRMDPPEGALSDKPAAEILTDVRIREMDPVELQRGLVEGRYKLPQ